MCFSPEVDLIAGVTIGAIGIDVLRHVDHPSQRPLAALPLIFGVHQAVEAVAWWALDGTVPQAVGDVAVWAYLAVAFGLLPWFVPWAVRRLEPNPQRARAMLVLSAAGGGVSAGLIATAVAGGVHVADGGRYLAYQVPLTYGGAITAAYVGATCGALLLSSDRYVALYGVFNLAAVSFLAVLLSSGVISLWCAWAAVTSGAIAVHLRRTDHHRHRFALGSA